MGTSPIAVGVGNSAEAPQELITPAQGIAPPALMSVVNSQDEWCQPLLPAEGGRFVVAHGWGRDLLDVGDKL